ncbi:MAG: hypothetical protein JW774_09090 [Candidatus Aureabacteria bacterium]|nr:hypothetical protein [Candidatus Auribacterota bacterium]
MNQSAIFLSLFMSKVNRSMIFIIMVLTGVFADESVLAPKSMDFGRVVDSMQLDIDLLRRINDSEDFIRAAEYYNLELAHKDVTWDKLIRLYEIFRADDRNSEYTGRRIREQRLDTVNNIFPNLRDINDARQAVFEDGGLQDGSHYRAFVSTLSGEKQRYSNIDQRLDIVFAAGSKMRTDSSYFITATSRLYAYIVSQQIFKDPRAPFEGPIGSLRGATGFDQVFSHVKGYQNSTYDGHHTFAWFVINYLLMNNGVKPLYFSPDDIERISSYTYNYQRIFDHIKRMLERHLKGDGSAPDPSQWRQKAVSG